VYKLDSKINQAYDNVTSHHLKGGVFEIYADEDKTEMHYYLPNVLGFALNYYLALNLY
jgi:hypothetical protein